MSDSVPRSSSGAARGNRPAEELIEAINDQFLGIDGGFSDWDGAVAAADAALRAERLAVVEEIRERLNLLIVGMGWENVAAREVKSILDEVGVAARSAQSDSAGLTAEDHRALAEAAEERAFRGVAGLTEERT